MESIMPLKGLDRVRKRPLVFFDAFGIEGCECAIGEIIRNAVNEAKNATKNEIVLELFDDNSVSVTDFGNGLPINEQSGKENKFLWEIIFTELYSDNDVRFDEPWICPVQYCSEYMDVTVFRDAFEYQLHFEKGINIGGLKSRQKNFDETGTSIKFKLDKEVFGEFNILDSVKYFEILFKGCSLTNKIDYTIIYPENDRVRKKTFRYGHRCG